MSNNVNLNEPRNTLKPSCWTLEPFYSKMVSFWDPWCFEPYQAYIPNRSKEIPIPTPPCDKTPTQRNIQNLHVNDRKNHYANDAVETTQVKLRILVEIQCYHWDSDLLSLQGLHMWGERNTLEWRFRSLTPSKVFKWKLQYTSIFIWPDGTVP